MIKKDFDTYDFSALPALSKPKILELARGDWVDQHANCCFIGNTGTGKTHLTIAAAQKQRRLKFYMMSTQTRRMAYFAGPLILGCLLLYYIDPGLRKISYTSFEAITEGMRERDVRAILGRPWDDGLFQPEAPPVGTIYILTEGPGGNYAYYPGTVNRSTIWIGHRASIEVGFDEQGRVVRKMYLETPTMPTGWFGARAWRRITRWVEKHWNGGSLTVRSIVLLPGVALAASMAERRVGASKVCSQLAHRIVEVPELTKRVRFSVGEMGDLLGALPWPNFQMSYQAPKGP